MIIGKSFKFEAAHHLPHHWKCGQTHGHTYTVKVEVSGRVNTASGMVMDLNDLSEMVKPLLGIWDHSDLNSYFEVPTCERLCDYLFESLECHLPEGLRIHSVLIQEGEGGYALRLA